MQQRGRIVPFRVDLHARSMNELLFSRCESMKKFSILMMTEILTDSEIKQFVQSVWVNVSVPIDDGLGTNVRVMLPQSTHADAVCAPRKTVVFEYKLASDAVIRHPHLYAALTSTDSCSVAIHKPTVAVCGHVIYAPSCDANSISH